MQRVHPVAQSILERFALLLCIGFIWAFAAILTVAGAYNHVKEQTKMNCRIDHSFLLSSAPWYSAGLNNDNVFSSLSSSDMYVLLRVGSKFLTLSCGGLLYSELAMSLEWWVLHLYQQQRFTFNFKFCSFPFVLDFLLVTRVLVLGSTNKLWV